MSFKRKIKRGKELEVKGHSLLSIKGQVFHHPEKGLRAFWEIPDESSPGMMYMLWLVLTQELNERMSDVAPVKEVFKKIFEHLDVLEEEARKAIHESGLDN